MLRCSKTAIATPSARAIKPPATVCARARQALAGARQVGLQLRLLRCGDLVEQVEQRSRLRHDLHAIQVQILVGPVALQDRAHLQGQLGVRLDGARDAVEMARCRAVNHGRRAVSASQNAALATSCGP